MQVANVVGFLETEIQYSMELYPISLLLLPSFPSFMGQWTKCIQSLLSCHNFSFFLFTAKHYTQYLNQLTSLILVICKIKMHGSYYFKNLIMFNV